MGTSRPLRHLKLVGELAEPAGRAHSADHSDRAARMIVELLKVWGKTITHELSVESASRIGLVIATEHLTLARAQPAAVP